jgi:hypothetical protein
VVRAFEACSYNHQEAARMLKIHPNNLHRLIRTLGMKDMLRASATGLHTKGSRVTGRAESGVTSSGFCYAQAAGA